MEKQSRNKEDFIQCVQNWIKDSEITENSAKNALEFLNLLQDKAFNYLYVSPDLYGGIEFDFEKHEKCINIFFNDEDFDWMVADSEEWFSEENTPYGEGAFEEILAAISCFQT